MEQGANLLNQTCRPRETEVLAPSPSDVSKTLGLHGEHVIAGIGKPSPSGVSLLRRFSIIAGACLLLTACGTSKLVKTWTDTGSKVSALAEEVRTNSSPALAKAATSFHVVCLVATQQIVRVVSVVETNAAAYTTRRNETHDEALKFWQEIRPYLIGALALLAARYGLTTNSIKGDWQKLVKPKQSNNGVHPV